MKVAASDRSDEITERFSWCRRRQREPLDAAWHCRYPAQIRTLRERSKGQSSAVRARHVGQVEQFAGGIGKSCRYEIEVAPTVTAVEAPRPCVAFSPRFENESVAPPHTPHGYTVCSHSDLTPAISQQSSHKLVDIGRQVHGRQVHPAMVARSSPSKPTFCRAAAVHPGSCNGSGPTPTLRRSGITVQVRPRLGGGEFGEDLEVTQRGDRFRGCLFP